jgi:hypothetical protein
MSEDFRTSTCEEFQNQLADLIGSGASVEDHPHVKVCVMCSQLLHDLKTIADNSRRFRFGANEFNPDDWSETTCS